ncbi:D-glucuronyl C5-epimerase family protein [Virgibacillus ainsalahensis]
MKMPNFTTRLETVSKHRYKVTFMDDGYPGKDLGDTVACHPIYGIYVIRDYLFQYKKTKDIIYQKAAIKVADAAIRRMEQFKNSLVFWYKSDSFFNSTSKDYYSGLTQAYYAEVMAQLYVSTKTGKYKEAAKSIYNSLKIPFSEGGVFHYSSKGPSIQEYPMSPNGYVLNGWLSAISSIKNYADLLQDDDATLFWRENLNTVCRLLPLYDAPLFSNSRYTLNGSTILKINASRGDVELQGVNVNVPGEGTFESLIDSKRNYANYIDADSVIQREKKTFTKNHEARLHVLLSRFSYPEENEVVLRIVSNNRSSLRISLLEPMYSPKMNKHSRKYIQLDDTPIQKGENLIKIKIPWKHLNALATPTTFKQFGSKWHNVYHFIHINRLEEFYKITKDKRLLNYMNKWKKYVDSWKDNPLYKGLEMDPYNKK